MRHLAALFCLLVLSVASASAQTPTLVSFKPDANGQINFVMPSHNIGCTYTPAGGTPVYKPADGGPELACDRVEPTYVRVVLTPASIQRFDKVDDASCCGLDNVFAYGTRWSAGPFTCNSDASGLTCARSDGRGFQLSRASIDLR